MAKGWDTHVYRTDETPETYIGFFFDAASAEKNVKDKEGTYEVTTEKPRERKARLGSGPPDKEAASD